MNDDLFLIEILNTKISFRSKENKDYMEQIISILQSKTKETQTKLKVTDPLKCSILTSLFLIDELMKSNKSAPILLENHLDRLVQNLSEALE
ncbi:MAG: cell division protein ZapA [Candidatus Delongbacteria bacterium]|nr:cell division protein ZapA [Candidatus Delongbacteria bacterium]MBN2836316.1 cell division protein ZapA [Candidatus Delongbacteria bacterium]